VAPVLAVPASPLQPVSPLQVAPAAPVAAPAPPSPLLVLPLLQSITQGEGVRWVLFSGNDVIVRGLNTDEEQARKAREGFTGDLLWFRLDGKSYVTQDRETMDQMVFGVSPASQRARDAETAERMRQQAAAQQAAAQQEAALASAAEQRKALQDVQAMARQIDEQIRNAAPPPSQNLVELQRAATELQAATVRLQAHLASREANLRQAEAQLQMMQAMNQNLQRNSAVINRLNEAVNSRNEGLLREAVRTGKAQVVP
jgi:hypothetical protein